jgi:large repetitive protein
VKAGQFVTVSDINLGRLKFTPAANASGLPSTSFTFQVQDNGGTANGGTDLDPTPNTMTINVTPVNDRPTWTLLPPSGSISVNEGQNVTFRVQANANDAGQTMTYSLRGTVPAGASINATTGAFSWTPNSTQGTADYTITFRATEAAGTFSPLLFVETSKVIRVKDVRR